MNGKERERPYLRDPDDPEYIKDLQRPAVIKEDLSEMERRKRVQQILESKSFCRELEEVIQQECDSARSDPDHLQTLQRLTDLTISRGNMAFLNLHSNAGNIIPIADIKGNDLFSKIERIQRNKVASLFRLADLFQWSQGIHNEITYRMNEEGSEFLVNPYGLLYHEITAGTLVKVNKIGEVLNRGTLHSTVNQNAFLLHAAIYKSRPNVKCILHMHTAVVAAISSMKCGLLPLCQEAMSIGPVAYHDYQEIGSEENMYEELVKNFENKNVLFLRNQGFIVAGDTLEHATYLANNTVIACETQVLLIRSDGCIVVGETVEEASVIMRDLVTSCDHQVRAARAGIENLIIPNEQAIQKAFRNSRSMSNSNSLQRNRNTMNIDWRFGELEWESWMRVLDHANFRTGHIYRQPQLRPKSAMSTSMVNNNDVALPPASSAYGQIDESDAESVAAHRMAMLRKEHDRVRWLNSPNAYQKVEILEYGADYPKKITKWVQDVNTPSASGTPVRISNVHQFSPASTNPKEFKEKQKSIKENSRLGTNTAGPQSQILDNLTYEDISLIIRPDNEGTIGQSTINDRAILIGTASKGIIDRDFQHHAQVYHQLYAPNPFSVETDEGIRKYIEEVKTKNAGLPTSRSDINYSQFDEVEDDTVSLMQGVREHRLSQVATMSASDEAMITDTSSSRINASARVSPESVDTSYMSHSVVLDYFPSPERSVSPKFDNERKEVRSYTGNLTIDEGTTTTSRSFTNGSGSGDDVCVKEEKKKKKKKGLLSFIRKKDKSTSS